MNTRVVSILSLAVLFAASAVFAAPPPPKPESIAIDFTVTAGRIKALHGVEGAPFRPDGRQGEVRRAGIPWVKTSAVCDVASVFPDGKADETRPENYDFGQADAFLKPVVATGARLVYWLGSPTGDPAKWARVCERVIRHFNEGWNGGFKWKIGYWEIDDAGAAYRPVATYLKKRFPKIRIGGPVADPKIAAPLDFRTWTFEWNEESVDYSDVQKRAKAVRAALDAAGRTACESVLTGWHSLVNGGHGQRGQFGAAFCGDMFCLLQDAPVAFALYGDAMPESKTCGLFEPIEEETTPCYGAFVAWNELYRLGGRVKAPRTLERFGVIAATDGRDKAFLLVNGFERARKIRPDVKGLAAGETFTLYRLGGAYERLTAVGAWKPGEEIELPHLGIALVATGFKGPRQILIAGDSLLERRPGISSYGSWGECLAPYLKDDVTIENLARSGRSSKSFVDEGRWATLLTRVRKGDWVIVSFGHNDVARDPKRQTDLKAFQAYFERFADDVRARGGNPVFVSPTQNRNINPDGSFTPSGYVGERAAAMKAAADAKGALFIDFSAITAKELVAVGKEKSHRYYMIQRTGNFDNQHTTRFGARRFAQLFVEAVRTSGSPFADLFMKEEKK